VSSPLHARGIIDQFSQERPLRIRLPGYGRAFSFGALGLGSTDRLIIARPEIPVSIPAQRSGPGSRPVGHADGPSVPASRRNTCCRTSILDLDNKVDPRRQPPLSLRRNTARGHKRDHSLDNQRSSLYSLRRQARRKLKPRAPSISSSSYGYSDSRDCSRASLVICKVSFARSADESATKQHPGRAWRRPPSRSRLCWRRPRDCPLARTLPQCPKRF
jgi:hypothetical protein